MSNPKSVWVMLLCVLIMGISLGRYVIPNNPKEYFEEPGFKTDTVTYKTYKADTGGSKTSVIPPKIVYLYTDPPKPKVIYVPNIVHDTIKLTDTLTGKTVNIYPCWYNNYMGIPKIIAARFTKNGISLDVYDTACRTSTRVYKTTFEDYDYYWDGQDIEIAKAHISTIPKVGAFGKLFSTSCNLYITQELLTQTPHASIDYSLNYKKVGLYGMGSIGYKSDLTTDFRVGIRLRIK